jgi:hypothetical protein
MNVDEKTLARILFQLKVHSSNGQAYEDLFVDVMRRESSDFVPVKPQGRFGDRKNDGYDRRTGTYYQVFAPENPKLKQQDAVKKLNEDFAGLKKYWDKVTPVREFYFVFNDKYRGVFPAMEADLAAIKKDHHLRDCASFLAHHLEDRLMLLPDDQIQVVVGFVPNPSKIQMLDYSVVNEVINHVMLYKGAIGTTQVFVAPDFDEKIKFNGLSPRVGALLNSAGYQWGILDDYFARNSEFTKQSLRNVLNEMYQDALTKPLAVAGSGDSDLVFFDILDSVAPDQTQAVRNAGLVLMAYFFESCDIFEDPTQGI